MVLSARKRVRSAVRKSAHSAERASASSKRPGSVPLLNDRPPGRCVLIFFMSPERTPVFVLYAARQTQTRPRTALSSFIEFVVALRNSQLFVFVRLVVKEFADGRALREIVPVVPAVLVVDIEDRFHGFVTDTGVV